VSFTSANNPTGEFDVSLLQENDLLRPFEGSGVATDWTFELPKAANRFEYGTIADVLLTMDYTALFSQDYRSEVVERLGTEVGSRRGECEAGAQCRRSCKRIGGRPAASESRRKYRTAGPGPSDHRSGR